MTTAIFFDESGFTGNALLDPEQPHFCVVSSLVGDAEAREILQRTFPDYAGQEFKFSNLWRKPRSRQRLTHLAHELAEQQEKFFLYHIDKRFCVLTKMIDFLVEPVVHDAGFDFYRNSYAPKFTNLVYAQFLEIGKSKLYEATIARYYGFTRNPTLENLQALHRWLSRMASRAPRELRSFFKMASAGAATFHSHSNIETFSSTFEVQLTSVLSSVGYWRHKLTDDFELFHDASNNFFSQRQLWDAITADDVPPQLHAVANGPAIEFPLRVRSTTPVDSRTSWAIQLCDAIAGLTVKNLKEPANEEDARFRMELITAGLGELTINGVHPGAELPPGPPEPLDGPDAVDQMLTIINRRGRVQTPHPRSVGDRRRSPSFCPCRSVCDLS